MTGQGLRIWHQSYTVLEDLPAYAELLQKHADRVTSPGTSVILHGMRPGTYPSHYPGDHIRYSYLQRRHAQQFIDAALRAQADGFSAYFIATLPDVAFEDIRTLLDIPVVAFCQASLLVAATLAPTVGIVNFIEALSAQVRRNAAAYGLAGLLGPVIQLDGTFRDVTAGYSEPGPLIDTFRAGARKAIDAGARALIPGEGPLNVFLANHGITQVDGIPVVDSLAAGLAMCELRARLARTSGLAAGGGGLYHDRPSACLIAAVHEFYRENGGQW
jgi:Asp/Glu/hydantoin racemase